RGLFRIIARGSSPARNCPCYHRASTGASGGIGRRAGFRFLSGQPGGGSSPLSPTKVPYSKQSLEKPVRGLRAAHESSRSGALERLDERPGGRDLWYGALQLLHLERPAGGGEGGLLVAGEALDGGDAHVHAPAPPEVRPVGHPRALGGEVEPLVDAAA